MLSLPTMTFNMERTCSHFLVLFFWALSILPSSAWPAKLPIKIKTIGSSSCEDSLSTRALSAVVTIKKNPLFFWKGRIGVPVGGAQDLYNLLVAAKVPKRDAEAISSSFESTKKRFQNSRSVVGQALKHLESAENRELELLAVLPPEVSLNSADAMFLPVQKFVEDVSGTGTYQEASFLIGGGKANLTEARNAFNRADERSSDLSGDLKNEIIKLKDNNKKAPNIIILKPDMKRVFTLITDLIHEATHSADKALLDKWVTANIRLLERGLPSDALFNYYVQKHGDVFFMDRGFITIFTESRAYHAEVLSMEPVMDPKTFKKYESIKKRDIMKQLSHEQYGSVLHYVSQNLYGFNEALSEGNVFEVGERWETIMENTIQRAPGKRSPN
ncbi:MAG: hypothetical protein AB1540_10995 [Bdellovibrionota bacterium]